MIPPYPTIFMGGGKEEYMIIKKDDLKLPLVFEFAKYSRFITLFFGFLIFFWTLIMVVPQIHSDSHVLRKITPFLILFFAFDVIQRNLFSIRKIVMNSDALQFYYIAKKRTIIVWHTLLKVEKYHGKGHYFLLHYVEDGIPKKYFFPMVHRDIIDILNFIKIIAPHIETDDFVSSLLIKIDKET